MTQEEFNKIYQKRKAEYNAAIISLTQNERRKMESDIKPYEQERKNTINKQGIEVGDIIIKNDIVIQVKHIFYERNDLYLHRDSIEFKGILCTKKLEPRKDGQIYYIRIYEGDSVGIIKK